MNIKTTILLTIIATATTIAAIPQYDIIPLGNLLGDPSGYTSVFSINDHGQIVGKSSDPYGLTETVILYQPGEYDTAINLMPGQTGHRGIVLNNNAGQIVGLNYSGGSLKVVMFDETGQGNNVVIETNGTFSTSDCLSINDLGQIPGSSSGPALFNTTYPYYISRFDLPRGFTSGSANGINNLGQMVGIASYQYDGKYYDSATLFARDGAISLGTLGGDFSMASAINNSGLVVGMADDEQGHRIATIFDSSGQGNNVSLGLHGCYDTLALSVNDNGQIVILGRDERMGAMGSFLYMDSVVINIEDLIPLDSGWKIDVAWDINNLNQIIGWGDFNGEQRAFLMTPVPEPATLTILAIGALLIHRRLTA